MKLEEFYQQFHIWVVTRGPKYVFGLILFFAGIWFIRLLRSRLRARMSKRQIHSTLQPFFLSLTITAMYILLVISVMQIIGIEMTIFTTVIGAFSVAAGLALSGTLQNFAGGVLILLLKPFEINDSILAQGQEGTVTSIQLFYTVLLTADNRTIIIPNGKLFNEVIVNVTREGKRRLDFELKLGYIVDVEQVKSIIEKAINGAPKILKDEPIQVGVIALEIDGIKFTIKVWVNPDDYLTVKLYLQEKIIKDLRDADVKLPLHHLLPGT
ncbi:MAG TPA: mechanosensitive ion channel domain-containing protein [Mucilaginibacter sp.]|nr:mechanosensitive ion channel domain-containing protein [Mucilaginibacter sp.]